MSKNAGHLLASRGLRGPCCSSAVSLQQTRNNQWQSQFELVSVQVAAPPSSSQEHNKEPPGMRGVVTCAAASCDGPVAVCPTGGEGHTRVDGTPSSTVALAGVASQRAAAAGLPDNIRVGGVCHRHTAALCDATGGT